MIMIKMDLRFKFGSVMLVVGASNCGKTTFIQRLLESPNLYFDTKPQQIVWHYGEVKPTQAKSNIIYKKGLPSSENILHKSIIIIDDLFIEARNDANVTNLFTRVAHHKQCFIIFITQNMYHASSQSRTRNLNTHYLVIFKNPRDKLQIRTLATQMCNNFFFDAYMDATSEGAHKYLLLDFRQETPDNVRIRTNIFHGEAQYAYVAKNKYKQCYNEIKEQK